jgi:hypothetical protein
VIWHLYFDGEPTLVGHICDHHRTLGRLLSCADAGPDGDCEHIQTRACDCLMPRDCDICEAYAPPPTRAVPPGPWVAEMRSSRAAGRWSLSDGT